MIKKFILAFVILGAIFGTIIFIKSKQFSAAPPMVFPPETVTSAEAREMVWERTIPAVGSLRAQNGIEVAAEVPGIISAIHFDSGQEVSAGDILVELDISVEEAQLRAAEAAAELAQVNLERSRELREKKTIPQADLDAAVATAKETAANVESIRARIDQKTIRAPFDGRLGIRLVDLGEFLNTGQSIAQLQDLKPILLDFTLPQNRLSQVRTGLQVRISVDAWPGEAFLGEITAVDPEVDRTTRSFQLEASFPNSEDKLRGGMYASVEVILPEGETVVAIPSTAIYRQSYGNSVFAVVPAEEGSGQMAEQRFVRTGSEKGDFTAVLEGVEIGESVVTAGLFKLSNGRSVVVDNSQAPEFSLNPDPENR